MAEAMTAEPESDFRAQTGVDWAEVARLVLTSRAMDELEETRLVPEKKVLYQFSARGHDMAQVILGMHLRDGDAACGYYRSRPMLLALGVPLADALGSGMGLAGGYSDGRDIGVVFNYPNPGGATPCRCAAGSARNIRRRPAGRRRSPTRRRCWARRMTAPSRWCSAAMPVAPPADFGPP